MGGIMKVNRKLEFIYKSISNRKTTTQKQFSSKRFIYLAFNLKKLYEYRFILNENYFQYKIVIKCSSFIIRKSRIWPLSIAIMIDEWKL